MTAIALAADVQELARKPTLARVPGYAPIVVADWQLYRLAQRANGLMAIATQGLVDSLSEEDFSTVVESLVTAIDRFDWYLSVRGDKGFFRARIKAQRDRLAEALECLKRGYAPGHLPSEEDRLESASDLFNDVWRPKASR